LDDPTGRIAEVTWEDSATKHGWSSRSVELPRDGGTLQSVGYVLQDDAHGVILVETWNALGDEEYRYGCQIAIPRSAIRKVKYLRGSR